MSGLLVMAVTSAGVAVVASSPAGAAGTTPLIGTFTLAPGAESSASAPVTGSYFRMLQPGGSVASGPYLANANSSLPDQTYTPFTPGTDGGLITGVDQSQPSPAFDSNGGSLSKRIIQPTPFFGVNFGVSTNATDLQTGTATALPSISVDSSGNLSGNLSAFDASWNNQQFNQGSPKPDGSHPGVTADPTGTYNASTGAYTITWASQIVSGPFNNFTGVWHLTGTFTPAAPAAPTVTHVSPTSGPATGGNSVVITGTGLDNATAVKFGATAATITADAATSITVTAPGGSGTVDVTVTTPNGTSAVTSSDRYSYTTGGGTTPPPSNPLEALLAALVAALPHLPPPSQTGGIGSIFPIISLFGPFTSEAVSWLPVINALTPLLAPLLPTFGLGITALKPILNILVPVLNRLEQQGYDAIAPIYAPYRLQILLEENKLATAFAPYVTRVVNLPTLPYLQSVEGLIADALGELAAAGKFPIS